ncbi:hypothetical protein GOB57_23910 [Sinorhizobium meliloti]|nr:hypothetical protein [Sinorhizobium meliloti]
MAIDNGIEGGLTLSETLLAMDIADTIRHDDRMREFELTDGDRRNAAIERLRKAYEAQGDVVPDHVLERAIDKRNEERFVHKTMAAGPRRILWTAFVRRGRYGRNAAAILAAVAVSYYASTFGYDQLVSKPRREAERRLELQIEEVIPRDLASAIEFAEGIAKRLGDAAAIDRIGSHRKTVEAALAARNAQEAERGVLDLRAVGQELKRREDSVWLVAEADALTADPISKVSDRDARDALIDIASQMRDAAMRGDLDAYGGAVERFKSFAGYILTPYKIQIVDRPGISAGVELTDKESGVPAWYMIVEAVSPSGIVKSLEIKDRNRKPTRTVPVWGIRVTRDTYLRVRNDKKSDGVIDENVAGEKPAGTLRVNWRVDDVNGQTINYWVDPKQQAGRNR